MPRPISVSCGILQLTFLLTSSGGSAQEALGAEKQLWPIDPETAPRPVGRAFRATTPMRIDGRLDELAWGQAEPMANFVQAIPNEGYPATEPTEVRILYDEDNLYIGAMCYDSEPDKLVVKTLEWELPGLSTHEIDVFNVFLDTYLDRRNSFMYVVNPGGAYRDGQSFNDSRNLDFGWDAIVEVRTEVHDSGWTVEMAIPWTSLRFDPNRDAQVWGVNFFRRAKRKLEDSFWAPLDRRDRGHRMSKAGTLVGLPTVEPGRNLSVRPFAVAGRGTGPDVPRTDLGNRFDAGIDLKYGVTPRLTADLTFRTDFSHVDVDRQQVNLTRFPLFFPEQRDFFLENSGTFQFGDLTERNYRAGSSLREFTLFHSRQIGLRSGRPVPIVGGGRLSGYLGGFELGLLDVQTDDLEGSPPENFSVLRVRRNILGSSDVGVMVANRQATDGSGGENYNRSYGVDANVSIQGGVIVNSYVAQTWAPGKEEGNTAARMNVGFRDRLWDVGGFVQHIGTNFDPGIGFVRRTGIRHFYGTVGAHPRPRIPFVLDVNPYVEGHYVTDVDGVLETRTTTAGLGVAFQDGGILDLQFSDHFERVVRPFDVGSSALVPTGDYDFREVSTSYTSNRGREISGNLEVSGGGYFGGNRRSVRGTLLWEPGYHTVLTLSATSNNLTVERESFTADLYSAQLRYAYSTKLYGGMFLQYNDATDELVTDARLTLIHAPLSNLYIVFRDVRHTGGTGPRERLLTAKLTKYFQF